MSRPSEKRSQRVMLAAMTMARRYLGVSEIAALVGKTPAATRQVLYLLRAAGCVESDERAYATEAFLKSERKWRATGVPLPAPKAPQARADSPARYDHRALAAALGMDVMQAQPGYAHTHRLVGIH